VMLASIQGVLVGIPMVLLRRRAEQREGQQAPDATPPVAAEAAPPPGSKPEDGEEDLDDWTPDPHSVPFGPFLSLAAAEVLYFSHLPDVLFPLRLPSWLF